MRDLSIPGDAKHIVFSIFLCFLCGFFTTPGAVQSAAASVRMKDGLPVLDEIIRPDDPDLLKALQGGRKRIEELLPSIDVRRQAGENPSQKMRGLSQVFPSSRNERQRRAARPPESLKGRIEELPPSIDARRRAGEKPSPEIGDLSKVFSSSGGNEDPKDGARLPESVEGGEESIPAADVVSLPIMDTMSAVMEEGALPFLPSLPAEGGEIRARLPHLLPDSVIEKEMQNPDLQEAAGFFKKALEEEDHRYFRFLTRHIITLYSPVQIFAMLHYKDARSGKTLMHLLAGASSAALIYELQILLAAFSPFQKQSLYFQDIRGFFIPKEFQSKQAAPHLWILDEPLNIQNMFSEDINAFPDLLQKELSKKGNIQRILALVYGYTVNGKSLDDFLIHAPDFRRDIEDVIRWAALPLYQKDKKGKTPLALAFEKMKRGGGPENFILLQRAEGMFGMDTLGSQVSSLRPPPAASFLDVCRRFFTKRVQGGGGRVVEKPAPSLTSSGE